MTSQQDQRRLARRRVKQAVAACLATSALAAPMAWLVLSDEPRPKAPPAVASAPNSAPPRSQGVQPPSSVILPPKQAHVRRLASMPTLKLERVALEGETPIDRLAAISLLWERGEAERARELAQGDRLLTAKLTALKASRPTPNAGGK